VSVPASTEEGKSSTYLRRGSLIAAGGALVAVAVPAALVLLSRRQLYGLSAGSHSAVALEGLLVAVGAVLLLLAFLLYRRAFAHLRHADPRLGPASVLCLVGSVGAIAVVVAGALVGGGPSAVTGCLGGRSAHALACLRAADPTVGYLALAGFWLAWVGAVGVCVGLVLSGRHFRRRLVVAAGVVYAILVLDVVVPFAGAIAAVPGTNEALAIAPFAAVAAPLLVYVGTPPARSSAG
jgi:Protein of unknown function (DUF973)